MTNIDALVERLRNIAYATHERRRAIGDEAAVALESWHAEAQMQEQLANELRAERYALRAAIRELLHYEPEHCGCSAPICTQTRDAWELARAALTPAEPKEQQT